jgi:hypothetical protein
LLSISNENWGSRFLRSGDWQAGKRKYKWITEHAPGETKPAISQADVAESSHPAIDLGESSIDCEFT